MFQTLYHRWGFNLKCLPYKIFFHILRFVKKINCFSKFEEYLMRDRAAAVCIIRIECIMNQQIYYVGLISTHDQIHVHEQIIF